MQYYVYYQAIKEILDLVKIIQDQDLGKEMQLELMSQNLLVQIDQMVKYAKQLVSINQSEQQKQELNIQIEEQFSQELAQEQLFLQKDQQQDQQKQQKQEQYEQDQQQQLINIEQNLYIQQEQNLQSKQQEFQDQYNQEIQQQQNVQKKLSLKQQLQLQNEKQQQQKQQQLQQQQQQQQQEQQQQQQQQKQYQNLYEHKIQGSSVIFYPIKQPQYQNQNRQEVTLNHYNDKLKIKYNKLLKLTNGEIIDEKQYPQFNKTHMHEQCPICISDIFDLADQQDIIQLPCNHLFHCDCINQCINNDSLKCPIDQKIYGIIIGDQPDGTMISQCIPNKCEGYNCDTISIEYFFESGIKNGQPYTGTHRQAYLPNNPEGKEALELLKRCFNQKLTFTIGTSLTTGQQHQVVWNGIHHKTSLSGGPTRFGYPDNTYFQRLKQELSAKGIN